MLKSKFLPRAWSADFARSTTFWIASVILNSRTKILKDSNEDGHISSYEPNFRTDFEQSTFVGGKFVGLTQ